MRIFIPCIPAKHTAQQKRLNRQTGRFFKSEKEKIWESFLIHALSFHAPPRPMTGPLALKVFIVWPYLVKDKKISESNSLIFHEEKPDYDNAPKTLVDVLAKLGYFEDDKSIVDGQTIKLRGHVPGIYIDLTEVGSDRLSIVRLEMEAIHG